MKMADGGYRPAYNIQFTTATDSQIIVGVDVNNIGSDLGQLSPMLDQVEQRYANGLPSGLSTAATRATMTLKMPSQSYEEKTGLPRNHAEWEIKPIRHGSLRGKY